MLKDIAGQGTAGEAKGDTRTALPHPCRRFLLHKIFQWSSSDCQVVSLRESSVSGRQALLSWKESRSSLAGKQALLSCHLRHRWAWCHADTMRSCFLAIHGHFYPYFTCFCLCSPTCLALPHSKPLLLGVCQREQSVSITVAALHLCW